MFVVGEGNQHTDKPVAKSNDKTVTRNGSQQSSSASNALYPHFTNLVNQWLNATELEMSALAK